MKKDICALYARYLELDSLFAEESHGGAPERPVRNGPRAFLRKDAAMRLYFALHAVICKSCAEKKRRAGLAGSLLRTGFLPPSSAREDAIMAAVLAGEAEAAKERVEYVSVRGWITAGVIIVVSLISVYFNIDVTEFAHSQGISYILPLGITVGAVITAYSALFIGTHISMLCEKFGLE